MSSINFRLRMETYQLSMESNITNMDKQLSKIKNVINIIIPPNAPNPTMCRPYQLLFVNHWIAVKIIWTYLDARKQYLHTVTAGAKHKSITSRNNMVCKCLANGFWLKFEPQRLSCTSSRSNPFAAILVKHLQRPIYAQLLLDTGSLLITSDCCPRHLLGHWFLRKWTKKACIKMGPTANKT